MVSIITVLLCIATGTVQAQSVISGDMDSASYPGFEAEGLSWRLQLEPARAELHARRAQVAGMDLGDVQLDCTSVLISAQRLECVGRLRVGDSPHGPISAQIRASYALDTGRLLLGGDLDALGGQAEFDLDYGPEGARVRLSTAPFGLERFWPQGAPALDSGSIVLSGTVNLPATGPTEVDLSYVVEDLAFDSADGTMAAAAVGVAGRIQAARDTQATTFSLTADELEGEILLGDLYLDLSGAPLRLAARGRYAGDALAIHSFTADDAVAGVQARGEASIGLAGTPSLERLQVSAVIERLHEAQRHYLGDLLQAWGWGDYTLSGAARIALQLQQAAPVHASLWLDDVDLRQAEGRLALDGLNGEVHYDETAPAPSRLSFRAGELRGVALGAATVPFTLGPDHFRLTEPVRVPVLDGALRIEEMAVSEFDAAERSLDFRAEVEPISLRPLTESLGWPPFEGTLSGQIPSVAMRGDLISVGGAIELEAFQGRVVIEGLRLERLFGVAPSVEADVRLHALELQPLTRAFSFGEITGALEGHILGLRMVDWEPVAFDLDLHTPPSYRGRRKISQRAVENLSSVGGAGAALGATFLRFFERFGYERLGIECRLSNNVCLMGGIETAENGGYYIVKGRGLPRIDIIGYERKVNFPSLVRRLKAATEGDGPRIGED